MSYCGVYLNAPCVILTVQLKVQLSDQMNVVNVQLSCHGINGPPTNGSARSKYFRNIVPPGQNISKYLDPLNKVSSHGVQLGLS